MKLFDHRRRGGIVLRHRRQAEQQLHRAQHTDGRIHRAVDDAALHVGADDQAGGAVRIHVIGSVLRIVFDDEDRELRPDAGSS